MAEQHRNLENRKKWYKTWIIKRRKKLRLYHRAWRLRLKTEVFKHYCGKKIACMCCGEGNLFFLTIDHINGGGNKHRKENGLVFKGSGGGLVIYAWLKKNNYPKGFQVLCYNCNCGRSLNSGVCPHKQAP